MTKNPLRQAKEKKLIDTAQFYIYLDIIYVFDTLEIVCEIQEIIPK